MYCPGETYIQFQTKMEVGGYKYHKGKLGKLAKKKKKESCNHISKGRNMYRTKEKARFGAKTDDNGDSQKQ